MSPDDRDQFEPFNILPFKNTVTVIPKSYEKMPAKVHRNNIHALN